MKRKDLPPPVFVPDERTDVPSDVMQAHVDETFKRWQEQDCEGCDIHSDVCGNPDYCCDACPTLRRSEERMALLHQVGEDISAYEPTQPLGVTFDFNAKPPTAKFHGMDVCTSCDQLAHECKCGEYGAHPCPTSRTTLTLTGLLVAIAMICGLALVLIMLSSCARRETPAQQGVLTTAKESAKKEEPAWPANTTTTASNSLSISSEEQTRQLQQGSTADNAETRGLSTSRIPASRPPLPSRITVSTEAPAQSPFSATDTTQPLKPAEVRKVTFASASAAAPAQVRRRAVRSGSPPRVVRVDDHPEMVIDRWEKYRRPDYDFIAVQYAVEGVRIGDVLAVERTICSCIGRGYYPAAPHVRGSWLVFPIEASSRGSDQFFQLRYVDDARNPVVPRVRVKDLPAMAFAELK